MRKADKLPSSCAVVTKSGDLNFLEPSGPLQACNGTAFRYNLNYYKISKICCHNTNYVHINGHDRAITVILAKHCIKLPDDGSLVIRNMLEQF